MKSFLATLLLCLCVAQATDLVNAPPSFIANNKKYVYMDISNAFYKIEYQANTGAALVNTTFYFSILESGYPIFDSKNGVRNATLAINVQDSIDVNTSTINLPERVSKAVAIDQYLEPGTYIINFSSYISKMISYGAGSVRSAFWMSDLEDREFLEKYVPANFDFDRVQMNFEVYITGSDVEHTLMINCPSEMVGVNYWIAECPAYYSSSFLFYHLFESTSKLFRDYYHTSIDGRQIPVTIYSNHIDPIDYVEETYEIFNELEKDYGPWPHEQLIIYASGLGGMEYAGATMTSWDALGHEMHHSYFARSMGPGGGNAGWIDEALASWRDNNYPRGAHIQITNMAGKSPYVRETDRAAYTKGANFIAYLDELFYTSTDTGMLDFLKHYAQTEKYTIFSTADFEYALERYFGLDLQNLFLRYIYGVEAPYVNFSINEYTEYDYLYENTYHPQYTDDQLMQLL